MGSDACARKDMTLKSLGIERYQEMIECWNKSGLRIKIKGRESKESLEKEVHNSGSLFIGAFCGEELVGLVIADYDGRRGWINRLAVLPQYRRRSIASALISKAENFLTTRGAKVIAALVDRSNSPSRRLFEANGYKFEKDILYYARRESPEA